MERRDARKETSLFFDDDTTLGLMDSGYSRGKVTVLVQYGYSTMVRVQ